MEGALGADLERALGADLERVAAAVREPSELVVRQLRATHKLPRLPGGLDGLTARAIVRRARVCSGQVEVEMTGLAPDGTGNLVVENTCSIASPSHSRTVVYHRISAEGKLLGQINKPDEFMALSQALPWQLGLACALSLVAGGADVVPALSLSSSLAELRGAYRDYLTAEEAGQLAQLIMNKHACLKALGSADLPAEYVSGIRPLLESATECCKRVGPQWKLIEHVTAELYPHRAEACAEEWQLLQYLAAESANESVEWVVATLMDIRQPVPNV